MELHAKWLCALAIQNSQFETSTSSRSHTVIFSRSVTGLYRSPKVGLKTRTIFVRSVFFNNKNGATKSQYWKTDTIYSLTVLCSGGATTGSGQGLHLVLQRRRGAGHNARSVLTLLFY